MPLLQSYRTQSRSPAALAVYGIALVLVCFAIGASLVQWAVRSRVESITENAFVSVQAIDRMRLDLHREEFLVQDHVHAVDAERTASIEQRLAALDGDFEAAARAYEPHATFPGEAARWDEFRRGSAELRNGFPHVLALSNRDRDREAQGSLDALSNRLAAADEAGERLAELNRTAARAAETEVWSILALTNTGVVLCALAVIVLTLLIGGKAISAQAQVERSAQELRTQEERNAELNAFAGRVAHDLRGPLQIIGLSAARLSRFALPGPAGSNVVRINQTVSRLEAIIRDLLALSRLSGSAPTGSCDPAAAVEAVREELLPRLDQEGRMLQLTVEHASVSCSDGLMRQVVWNLVDNAVKYRRPDVPLAIEVRGRVIDEVYELRVSDNGSGMSPQDASQIFKPFYRGAHALTGTPGTGLGLSIVKRVADALSGTISVESELDRGTTFVLRVPCRRAHLPDERVSRAEPPQPAAPA